MRQTILFLITASLFSCKEKKVKVLSEEFSNGNPKTVFYFDNKDDASQNPIVTIESGIGYANKAVSFDEERYYENGKLHSKGQYIKGQTNGLWEYFYETGTPQARCYYQNGVMRDTVYCWYPSGKLKRVLVEIDTVKKYWHGFDYYENGNKSIESNLYKDSLDNWTLEGRWNEWFENGTQKFQAVLKHNWTVGKWQEWDDKGILTKQGEKPINITF